MDIINPVAMLMLDRSLPIVMTCGQGTQHRPAQTGTLASLWPAASSGSRTAGSGMTQKMRNDWTRLTWRILRHTAGMEFRAMDSLQVWVAGAWPSSGAFNRLTVIYAYYRGCLQKILCDMLLIDIFLCVIQFLQQNKMFFNVLCV